MIYEVRTYNLKPGSVPPGEPASSCPELIELARRHCAHVSVRPAGGN